MQHILKSTREIHKITKPYWN